MTRSRPCSPSDRRFECLPGSRWRYAMRSPWFGERSTSKYAPSTTPKQFVHPMDGVESFPLMLRKLTIALALVALLTASVGDATSFCRIACASGALHSSNVALGRHFGHAQSLPQNAVMHHHMSMTENAQSPSVTAFGGMVAFRLPQCSQFRQFAAFLDGSGVVVSDLSNRDVVTAPLADFVEVTTQAAPPLTESPPGSGLSLLATTSILRI